MNTRLPLRTRTNKKENEVKTSDILSFSSALIVVVSSAIFYLAGWFYLAHWYAFFGIDATQINLPTQTVIIHGLPSILILIVAGVLSASVVAIWKIVKKAERIEKKDFSTIVIVAYIIAFLVMGSTTILYATLTNNAIPTEVIFALVLSFVLAILIYQLNLISSYLLGETQVSIPGLPVSIEIPRAYAVNSLITKYIREGKYSQAIKLFVIFLVNIIDIVKFVSFGTFKLTNLDVFNWKKIEKPIEEEIRSAERDFVQSMMSQKNQLTIAFTETRQFWIGAVLILYLLVSISTSAIFGEWDAIRGRRLLVGDWGIPEISLYSTSAIPALEKFGTALTVGYEYKSLGLLSSDNNVYYLVDWKTTKYYQHKPHVYIVPRNDDLILNFIVSPFVYTTATPFPLPTKTLTPTLTPNPTVIFTITPTP